MTGMKLRQIRGGSIEELSDKLYTIGIGISLGNKWFTIENIGDLIGWSLSYSKDKVVVYVADTIYALTIEARNGKSATAAQVYSKKKGRKLLEEIKNEMKSLFSPDELSKIIYANWDQLVDRAYQNKVDYLYLLYKNNEDFREAILALVKEHISSEKRSFSEKALEKMAHYILEELPELIARVPIGGVKVDAHIYPFDGALAGFVEKIQIGEAFPDIRKNILDTEPKVFLEVR